MSYKITKKRDDARVNICGMTLPNGFTRVVDMTRKNVLQLEQIEAYGYNVEESDMAPGMYDQDMNPVDYDSVTRFVMGEGEILPAGEAPATSKEEDEVSPDIARLREQLDAKGIAYRSDAKAPALEKKLNEAN